MSDISQFTHKSFSSIYFISTSKIMQFKIRQHHYHNRHCHHRYTYHNHHHRFKLCFIFVAIVTAIMSLGDFVTENIIAYQPPPWSSTLSALGSLNGLFCAYTFQFNYNLYVLVSYVSALHNIHIPVTVLIQNLFVTFTGYPHITLALYYIPVDDAWFSVRKNPIG